MLRKMNPVCPFARLPVCLLKIKDYILCVISAVLLILSFPNFNIWLFAWFGFVPLFFALDGKSKPKAFLLAYLVGIIFWWGVIYWLVHVTFLGTFLLILYLALYFGLFGLFYPSIVHRPPSTVPFILASLWVILEYLRAHLLTGFPWALLGYSQYLNLPVIQIADITGAWGVSFLVLMVNVVIYSVARCPLPVAREKQKYFLPLLIIFFVLVYGYFKLLQANRLTGQQATIKISVIQGNIPQELKWIPASREYILAKYIRLTQKAAQGNTDLTIWPEAALPAVLEEEPALFERVTDAAAEAKTCLLLGAVTVREDFYYNSALLVSSQGKTLTKYNKLHLVPFGEYIPLRKILSFLETVVPIGEISPGIEYTIFELSRYPVIPLSRLNRQTGKQANGSTSSPSLEPSRAKSRDRQTKFAVLICFEDLFPGLSRRFVNEGADFLANITNDAWYKKTSAPYQHLQASIFRAVENRVNLIRAANTGVSGFIAPSGKIISLVHDASGRNIFIDGHKTQEIAVIEKKPTFYTRYGDIFIVACFLFLLYGITPLKKTRSSNVK